MTLAIIVGYLMLVLAVEVHEEIADPAELAQRHEAPVDEAARTPLRAHLAAQDQFHRLVRARGAMGPRC